MGQLKKITTTLSVATSILLGACSSGTGGSDGNDEDDNENLTPDPQVNTTAPLLIGEWQTACIITSAGTSTTTTGSSGSGGGSVTGGDSIIASASFTQDGYAELSTEYFSSTNCNTNTFIGAHDFEGVYFIGTAFTASDGSDAIEIDLSDSESTTYSIFQIVNGIELYLGNETDSTPGHDGGIQSNRYDGVGDRYLKK